MNNKCCIIFPNQLFRESIFIDSDYKIFLIEEDLFFNQYNFHKQKISFHRSSMKFYEDYLIKKGLDVSYINSYETDSSIIELIKNISNEQNALWSFSKEIDLAEPLGTETQLFFKLQDQEIISRMYNPRPVDVGEIINFQIETNKIHFFNYETKKAI